MRRAAERRMARWAVALVALTVTMVPRWAIAQDGAAQSDPAPWLTGSLVSGLSWRGLGPAFMSGRIIDIAVDPEKRSTWYVAAASGGVWKTTNAGTTWTPIFDHYGSYSIGCVAIDPGNRHTIWVGTGENNSQRSVGYGDGVYKSLDGGRSFTRVGLEHSEHIGKILIDPRNTNTVYVAAQGPLWAPGGDRGLYKTTDGGKTWKAVLTISENTGVSDIAFDPRDPSTIYASAYQRRRHVWTLIDGGPEGGIYKTTDAGANWRKLKSGLPSGDLGRIGLAVSPQRPDVVYALVEATGKAGGFYKSTDRGETWVRQSDYGSRSPQYYQEIYADPHVFDRVYSMDTYMQVTNDGGKTFQGLGERWKHVDNHAIAFDPDDEDHLLIGCDGGLYETWDRGKTYDFKANLPITQFYKIAIDNAEPFYHVYGGTQDNATQGGPTQTRTRHGIRNQDWFITVFGDGFEPAVDPEDPNIVYSEWQYGGVIRFDRRTGERVDIKPQEWEGGPALRWNWDSALQISPHQHTRLYYGAQILFRSDDRGDSWKAISGDLTRNLDRNKLKVMGRVWGVDTVAKNASTSFYGTIVSVSESPLVENLIYVGTDDGLIQITEDGGQHWRKVERFANLDVPEYCYVTDIEASLHDPDTVYVALYNFKKGDFKPYLIRSTDRGRTWTSIAGDLPERGSTYTVAEDHKNPQLLFVGTEFGVFFTPNAGEKWVPLKSGLPVVAVRDLEIQRRENDLVIGTFGRGFYVMDDYSPLRELSAELVKKPAHIFPISDAMIYVRTDPLGGGEKGFQGANYFTAPNPPFGATFTYFLKESLKTKKSQRQSKDRSLATAGKDVPYPNWEALKAEDREEAPTSFFTIRDESAAVVRRIPASTSKGLHRATWDYRLPGYGPVQPGSAGYGPMAVPGKYTVSLSTRQDGKIEQLAGPTPFVVEPLGQSSLAPRDRKASLAFQKRAGQLQRALLGAQQLAAEAQHRLTYLRAAIAATPKADPAWDAEARKLELALMDLTEQLSGDPTRPRRNEPAPKGMLSRLQTVIYGSWSGTYGPTNTHRQQYDRLANEFETWLPAFKKLTEQQIPALSRKLEAAGAPWTPGRAVPAWKK